MKPSLLLHEIIRSLSPEEKAAFLQGSSLQQGEKNYKKLFVYMDSAEEYNEDKAKEYFKNETFAKHLASEKNQLFHHILKSLRQQRIHDKSSFPKIRGLAFSRNNRYPFSAMRSRSARSFFKSNIFSARSCGSATLHSKIFSRSLNSSRIAGVSAEITAFFMAIAS